MAAKTRASAPFAPTGLDKAADAPAAAIDGHPAPSASGEGSTTAFSPPPQGTELSLATAQAAGVVDTEIFGQLLDMDDNDDHNFSKPLAEEYIEQADSTLRHIDDALASGDALATQLETLSGRGHFLKGSSAALGLIKVRESCEKLQNLGKCKDETGASEVPAEKAMERCKALLPQLKREQAEATFWLKGLCSIE